MFEGLWITRDPKGDRAYSIWSAEPTLGTTRDEWVPDEATGGRQVGLVITESFAVRLLGHELSPGQIEFLTLQRRRTPTAA